MECCLSLSTQFRVSCASQEKLPGAYSGAPGSPSAGANRYAGAEGVNFGDVEEDEGASGNPGLADLQQGSEGERQVGSWIIFS